MFRKITKEELAGLIKTNKDLKIVDVLSKAHYREEHIKGAISIPMEEIDKIAPKLLKKDAQVVVYCASFECSASTNAADKLIELGFTNVLDYKGGLKDYKEAGFPLEGSLHKKGAKKTASCCC